MTAEQQVLWIIQAVGLLGCVIGLSFAAGWLSCKWWLHRDEH
jgi:hypothetical protein